MDTMDSQHQSAEAHDAAYRAGEQAEAAAIRKAIEHRAGEHSDDIDVDCYPCREYAQRLGMGGLLPPVAPPEVDEDDGPDWDRYERDYKAGIEAAVAIVAGYAEAARRIGRLDDAVLLDTIIQDARRINPMTGEPTTRIER